jgi:DNA-binding CsgD family transcriptional regulator/ligand-binding sensor protein
MDRKPKYEELKSRIKELEQDGLGRIKVEKALKPNAEQIDFSNTGLENSHLVDGKYSITDLVDIEILHKALEKFSLASGFTAGLLEYPSQKILIGTGWRNICTKFHRAFPGSAENCRDSNIHLTEHSKELQKLSIKTCRNGLVDGVTPIVIRGKNIAYLITGQILFEKPDIKRFKKQAEMYGYDLEPYLEALNEVPIVSEYQFENALTFLKELSIIIAEIGLKNLELKERAKELEIEKSNLEEANIAMKVLLKKREEDRKEIEYNILTNVRTLIDPYFDKIKKTKLDSQQNAFLNIMESSLQELTSQFARKISIRELNLTPTEFQVANMIRHGNSSKEIAGIMNVSKRTVDAHRRNIRKKIGLVQKRTNLRSYLLSLH